jgi:hypothetical protein
MYEFEQTVLNELAELKTQMRALLGNGQPGRIHDLEARVEKHEALMQRALGIGALGGFAGTLIHVAYDLWKSHS